MIAGEIEIHMLAEIVRLKKQMDEVADLVRERALSMQAAANMAGKAIGGMLAGMSVAAFGAWIKSAIDAGDAVKAFSQKTGVAVSDVAGLQLAFKQGGVDGDALTASIAKMSRQMADGNGAFRALGIETRSADGSLRAVLDVLYDTADAFSTIKDGAARGAMATELFGKSGTALLPTLVEGADGLREMAAMAEKLGLVMDAQTADAADRFNDTTELLGLGLQGVARQVVAQMLPALNGLAGGFLDAMTRGDALRQMADVISAGMKVLYSVFVGGVQVVNTFGKTLGALAGQLVALAAGDIGRVRDIGNAWMADIKGDWTATVQNIGDVWSGAAAQSAEAGARMVKMQRELKLMSKEAEEAAKLAAAAEAKRAEEVRKLITGLQTSTEAMRFELDVQDALTAVQKEALAIMQRLRDGTLRMTDAEKVRLRATLEAKLTAEALTAAEQERLKALDAVRKATLDNAAAQAAALVEGDKTLQGLRDQVVEMLQGKDALWALQLARLEDAAAMQDQAAAQSLLDGLTAAESQAYADRAQQLRDEIALRRQLASLAAGKEAAELSARAAQASAQDWQRTADDIRSSLVDAFRRAFEAGQDRGKVFVDVIGREIEARLYGAMAGAFADGVLALLGLSTAQGGAGGEGGNSAFGTAANLSSLYSMAQRAYAGMENVYGWYAGVNAAPWAATAGAGLTAQTGTFGTMLGSSTGFGAGSGLGGTGAGLSANGGTWSGMFANEAAVSTGTTTAGTAGGTSMGMYALYAAIAIKSYQQARKDYAEGFRSEQSADAYDRYGPGITPFGGVELYGADLLRALGMSDRSAEVWSGATIAARMFGRSAPRIQETGVSGVFGSGDFAGQSYADIRQKGGWFRSDKNWTEFAALPEELGRLLDDAAKVVYQQATEFGEALGLPAELLTGVSTEIKVALTDDVDANQKALADVLNVYGDALVNSWAAAVKPVAAYGETTAQTIARVGAAMVGVNGVLDALSMHALQASVAGGQAAVALQDMFGGLQGLQQVAGSFVQNYFSEAERAAMSSQAISDRLAAVGLQMPASRAELRATVDQVVSGTGLLTEAGRQQFAALMSVQQAFADLVPAERDAADILRERQGLEQELLQLQGNTAELRRLELQALDPANRALQQQIWALQDQAEAADQATQAADSMANSMRNMRSSLLGGVSQAYAAVENAIQAERQRVEADAAAEIQALQQQADRISGMYGGLFASLEASVRQVTDNLTGDLGRGSAKQVLQDALLDMRRGRAVDIDSVKTAAAAAARVPGDGFASRLDYERELGRTATLLRDLGGAGRQQMSAQLAYIGGRQVKIEAERDAQLAALDLQLAQARQAAESLVSIDAGVQSIGSAIDALADAIAAVSVAAGEGGPVGRWLASGGAEVWQALGGAYAVRSSGAALDDAIIHGASGSMFTAGAARGWVNQQLAAGNQAGIVERALAEGIDSAALDALMGWASGTSAAEARRLGLQAFADGTAYVPNTGLALVHEGERILPAADNSALMRVLAGDADMGTAAEMRALRAEVAAWRAESNAQQIAIADHTSKTAVLVDRWDGDGMPPTRVEA